MRPLLVAMMIGALVACTVDGEVDESAPLVTECTDTRDGEVFSFHRDNVRNVRVGIGADTCFDVIDDGGQFRRLCSTHAQWLKCEARP